MLSFKQIFAASLIAGSMLFAPSANAMVVGQAVDSLSGGASVVGSTEIRNFTGTNNLAAIEYFIPLDGSNGVFGVDDSGAFGTTSAASTNNAGLGANTLRMFMRFGGLVANTGGGSLNILFEDLDLAEFSNGGLVETVQIFGDDGNSLINVTSSITQGAVTALGLNTAGFEILELALNVNFGAVQFNTLFLQLDFVSSGGGSNTAEYLRAVFDEDFSSVSPVPLPAALPLYGTGLAILGFIGWRRKRKALAA